MEDFAKEIKKEYEAEILKKEFIDEIELKYALEKIGYERLCYLLTDEQKKLTDQLPMGVYKGTRAFYELWDTIKDPKARIWLDECYKRTSNETEGLCYVLLNEIFKQKAIADGVIFKES
jgi:hypothetical protein